MKNLILFILLSLIVILPTVLSITLYKPQNIYNNTLDPNTTTTLTSTTTLTPTSTTTITTLAPTSTTTTTSAPITVPPDINVHTKYNAVASKNGNIVAAGFKNSNVLIAKFDSNGNNLWYNSAISSASFFYGTAISFDGNIYGSGNIYDNGDFGNGVIISASTSSNGFLIKYNSSGIAQWGKAVNSPTNNFFYGNGVDGNGDVYACGRMVCSVTPCNFGNNISLSTSDLFLKIMVVKYDSAGNTQWAKTEIPSINGVSQSSYFGIDVNTLDNTIYVVGEIVTLSYINDEVIHDFGNGVTIIVKNITSTPFIVKYNSVGITQWVKTTTTQTKTINVYNNFRGVAVSLDGYVYAAGSLGNTGGLVVDFGNNITVIGNLTSESGLLVKYDSFGIAQWVKTLYSGSFCYYVDVSVGTDGTIYAVGGIYSNGLFNFGDGVIITGTVASEYTEVVVAYSPTGTTLWARTTLSGNMFSEATGVTVDNSRVYSSGYMGGTTTVFNATVVDVGTATLYNNRFLIKRQSN